ncbi:hypothetical protein VNI00_009613 [Paramarasmius palmivorus]|uniref:Uncharacterized protein n=1 Tax=Paramarasmius palmivorus TaxID=297713 RepID=A0AAW0CNZ4_9AGAR
MLSTSSRSYIAFTSSTAQENGTSYLGFSPFFKLDGMSGSFDNPLESATSSIPIPDSFTDSAAESEAPLSTIVIGTLSTSLPPLTTPINPPASTPTSTSTTPVTSGFSTMVIPPSSTPESATRSSSESRDTSAAASASTQTQSSNSAANGPAVSLPMMGILSLCFFAIIPLA